MSTWADKIASLERRGWSLTSIAFSIDLSVSSVCDIKHGRTKAPAGMPAVLLHALADNSRIGAAQRKKAAARFEQEHGQSATSKAAAARKRAA